VGESRWTRAGRGEQAEESRRRRAGGGEQAVESRRGRAGGGEQSRRRRASRGEQAEMESRADGGEQMQKGGQRETRTWGKCPAAFHISGLHWNLLLGHKPRGFAYTIVSPSYFVMIAPSPKSCSANRPIPMAGQESCQWSECWEESWEHMYLHRCVACTSEL